MGSSLGCGKRFKRTNGKIKEVGSNCDFICGVPNGNGEETLCFACDSRMRRKWVEDDKKEKGGRKNGTN